MQQPIQPESSNNEASLEPDFHDLVREKKPHYLGWITILLIFGIFGMWAAFVKIDTTVLASGKVISKGYKKLVQHPRGGLVTKLYVQEGDTVKKGQPLLEIDSVETRSRLQSAMKQADELTVQKARLEAEAYNHAPDFEAVRSQLFDKKQADSLIAKERSIYESDLRQLQLKIEQLRNKNAILNEQTAALKSRIKSDRIMLASYEKELKKWQKLYDQNMTDELKLLDRQRKIEQIRADMEQAESKIRENQATIKANENQIQYEKSLFVNDARHKLKEITIKLSTIRENIAALKNEAHNKIVRAPDNGIITDMTIHSVGEVAPAGKPIAFIVPSSNKIKLEVYINPTDIDKIHIGQLADIHFPSYVDPAAIPVEGKITYISADTIMPEGAKQPFYKAYIEITKKGQEAIRENGFKIVPGMPVSVYIKAGKRSFISYILLPIEQLFKGAFHAN